MALSCCVTKAPHAMWSLPLHTLHAILLGKMTMMIMIMMTMTTTTTKTTTKLIKTITKMRKVMMMM
jgi:hypothetical protein